MNQIERLNAAWWHETGSGMKPNKGEDQESHVRRVSHAAACNAYLCAFGLIREVEKAILTEIANDSN